MAWLTTQTGRRYYYRKVWTGGTCQSQYVGGGHIGQMVAQQDELDRQQRRAQREIERRRLAEVDDLDRQIDAIGEQLQYLVTAALVASGYRQHKRQWRLQRGAEHSSG